MNSSTKNVIGVDIGGTNIRAALYEVNYSDQGVDWKSTPKKLREEKRFTDKEKLVKAGYAGVPTELLAQVKGAIDALLTAANILPTDVFAIGVDSAGHVDDKNGIVTYAHAFFDRQRHAEIPLKDPLSDHYKVRRVVLENDGVSGARGAVSWGKKAELGRVVREPFAEQAKGTVLYLTFSTGLGGALWLGRGAVPNIVPLEPGGLVIAGPALLRLPGPDQRLPPMGASRRVPGEWATFCSGTGITNDFAPWFFKADARPSSVAERAIAGNLQPEDLFRAAAAGDQVALDCVERIEQVAAAGIGGLVAVLQPKMVVIGGSIAAKNPRFLAGVHSHVGGYLPAESEFSAQSIFVADEDDVVALGAVANAVREDGGSGRTST